MTGFWQSPVMISLNGAMTRKSSADFRGNNGTSNRHSNSKHVDLTDKCSDVLETMESGISLEEQSGSRQVQQNLAQIQVALKHYYRKYEQNKVELQTLSTLLQEEREEKIKLAELNREYVKRMKIFKKRLENNNLSVLVDEKADLVPAHPSKRTLQDLMRENSKLKERLIQFSDDYPQQKEMMTQRIRSLEDKYREALERNDELQNQLQYLQGLRASSDNEKDAEIARLQQQIREFEENQNTQEVVSQSLMEEVFTVNKKLQDTAKLYKDMVEKIRGGNKDPKILQGDIEKSEEKLKKLSLDDPSKSADTAASGETATLQDNVKKLKAENIKLHADLKEAIAVNGKWHSYNEQREEYVRTLMEKKKTLESQLQFLQGPEKVKGQEEADELISKLKEKIMGLEEDKQKLESDLQELKAKHKQTCKVVSDLKTQLQLITQKRDRLETQNRALRQNMEENPWYKDMKESYEHMKAQLTASMEDFQLERKNSESQQSRVNELEAELAYYKRYEHAGGHYGGAVDLRSIESLRSAAAYQPHMFPTPRIVARGQNETSQNLDPEATASSRIRPFGPDSHGMSAKLECDPEQDSGEEEMEYFCPKCRKYFPSDESEKFFAHTKSCGY